MELITLLLLLGFGVLFCCFFAVLSDQGDDEEVVAGAFGCCCILGTFFLLHWLGFFAFISIPADTTTINWLLLLGLGVLFCCFVAMLNDYGYDEDFVNGVVGCCCCCVLGSVFLLHWLGFFAFDFTPATTTTTTTIMINTTTMTTLTGTTITSTTTMPWFFCEWVSFTSYEDTIGDEMLDASSQPDVCNQSFASLDKAQVSCRANDECDLIVQEESVCEGKFVELRRQEISHFAGATTWQKVCQVCDGWEYVKYAGMAASEGLEGGDDPDCRYRYRHLAQAQAVCSDDVRCTLVMEDDSDACGGAQYEARKGVLENTSGVTAWQKECRAPSPPRSPPRTWLVVLGLCMSLSLALIACAVAMRCGCRRGPDVDNDAFVPSTTSEHSHTV